MALHIDEISTKFDVRDREGNIIHRYEVVCGDELIRATCGREIESCAEVEEMIDIMTETVHPCVLSPFQVIWYVADEDEYVDYEDLGMFALKNKADLVIVESGGIF